MRREFHICPNLVYHVSLPLSSFTNRAMDTNPDLPRVRGSRPASQQVYGGALLCVCPSSGLPTMLDVFETLVWSSLESFQGQPVLILQF